MIAIFPFDEIITHIIGSETGPESVYFFRIKHVPKRRIHLKFPLEKIEYIEEPIVFIGIHIFFVWDFDESSSCR